MNGAPALPGIFHSLEPLLHRYGYLAVAGLVFAEDFCAPVPGETILIAAAVYAGTGRLNIGLVIVIGVLAATLGDNVGYALGRSGGRRAVLRFGPGASFSACTFRPTSSAAWQWAWQLPACLPL